MSENKFIADPLHDGKSKIQLIEFMGSDLSPVNDAKASFNRTASELDGNGVKLIKFLIDNNHTSPFRSAIFKFKIKAPLYVCRQWWRHVIASTVVEDQNGWNEQSFRYTEIDELDYYLPEVYRAQSTSNKQGSAGALDQYQQLACRSLYQNAIEESFAGYKKLLELGVAREQARGVLPSTVYTTWIWTCSLQAVLHFLSLRLGHGAQSEIVSYAKAIQPMLEEIVPQTTNIYLERMDYLNQCQANKVLFSHFLENKDFYNKCAMYPEVIKEFVEQLEAKKNVGE